MGGRLCLEDVTHHSSPSDHIVSNGVLDCELDLFHLLSSAPLPSLLSSLPGPKRARHSHRRDKGSARSAERIARSVQADV